MDAPAKAPSLAATVAAYETRVRVLVPPAAGYGLLLAADPRRWYVEFRGFTGATTNPNVYPNGGGLTVTGQVSATGVQVYKFRDCPALTTGPFYAFNDGTASWLVIEELYVR